MMQLRFFMALYWAVEPGAVAERNFYIDRVRGTETYGETQRVIQNFRDERKRAYPGHPYRYDAGFPL